MLETVFAATAGARSYETINKADNRLTENIAVKFIGALTELESARDVESMIALFADDCKIGNIVVPHKFHGLAGTRRFWTHYRSVFKDVCSIFQNEIYTGSKAKLEWTTEGRSVSGRRIKYEGMSFLKTKDGKITSFYARFDRRNLSLQITKQIGGRHHS